MPTPSSTASSTTPTASTCPATVSGGHAQSRPRELDQTNRSVPRITSQRGSKPWATSCRNPGRHQIGMPGRLRRNPQRHTALVDARYEHEGNAAAFQCLSYWIGGAIATEVNVENSSIDLLP